MTPENQRQSLKDMQPHKSKKTFRPIRKFVPVAVASALVFLAACSHSDRTDPSVEQSSQVVGVATVARRDLANQLSIAAEFHPFQEIQVDAKVPGYVKSIFVDVGDHVHEGQVLAVLEIPELEDELRQNKAAVLMAEQQVDQARAELRRDQSSYTVAHLEYSRLADVIKKQPDLVAQQDVDNAQGKDQGTEAQVSAAKANLGAAQASLSVAKANEAKTATLFAYSRIVAPFTGIITRRYADTGAMMPAGTSSSKQELPLVQLSQNDLLRLEIPVPEDDTPKIHLGTPVDVHVKALGQTVQGKVARFADSVDMATRTMLSEVDVPNPDYKLIPGMYANATIVLEQRANAIAAPVQALYKKGNEVVAFVVNGQDRVEERPLKIGIRTADYAEVLEGIQPGERVAVSQLDSLHNGQTVEPRVTQLTNLQEAN